MLAQFFQKHEKLDFMPGFQLFSALAQCRPAQIRRWATETKHNDIARMTGWQYQDTLMETLFDALQINIKFLSEPTG